MWNKTNFMILQHFLELLNRYICSKENTTKLFSQLEVLIRLLLKTLTIGVDATDCHFYFILNGTIDYLIKNSDYTNFKIKV
jgi:hypothetical protein